MRHFYIVSSGIEKQMHSVVVQEADSMIQCDVCGYVNDHYKAGDQCDACGWALDEETNQPLLAADTVVRSMPPIKCRQCEANNFIRECNECWYCGCQLVEPWGRRIWQAIKRIARAISNFDMGRVLP